MDIECGCFFWSTSTILKPKIITANTVLFSTNQITDILYVSNDSYYAYFKRSAKVVIKMIWNVVNLK